MTKATARKAAREVRRAEQAREALQIRLAGHTYAEVATRLGMSGEGQAYKVVQRALVELPKQSAEEYRAIELARLEEMHRHLSPTITAEPKDVGASARCEAVGAAIRASDRRAKLLGLDAPTTSLVASTTLSASEWDAYRAALLEELCDGCKEKLLSRVRERTKEIQR